MVTTIKATVSIPKALFRQYETLAQQLNVSQNQLFEMALENFIKNHPEKAQFDLVKKTSEDKRTPHEQVSVPVRVDGEQEVINQGDVFWIRPEDPGGAELGYYSHPYVVIQDNLFNHSRIHSVVVCALTSNLKQANAPGNVLLDVGEANLPQQSAVVVSKVTAVNKSALGEYIGSLDEARIYQILAGIRFLHLSFFAR